MAWPCSLETSPRPIAPGGAPVWEPVSLTRPQPQSSGHTPGGRAAATREERGLGDVLCSLCTLEMNAVMWAKQRLGAMASHMHLGSQRFLFLFKFGVNI